MKNFKRLTAIVLAFIIIALTLPTISVFAADADARYGRTKLNADEQYVYDALVEGCKDAKADIKIDITGKAIECTQEHLGKIYDIFYSDYPEYFWITNGWGASCAQNGSTVTLTMQPTYSMTGSTLNTAKSKYDAKVSEITNGLSGKSDYEKSKIIHDRLIDTVTYTPTENDQTSYGALVEGKAVCNGYAKAYQHLLLKVGIPAWFVTGSSINPNTNTPEPHAWNLAKIDGQWYYTDVTWDDQGTNTFYAYFNITTKQLLENHTIDAKYTSLVPQATATAANYYKKEGREFSSYDQTKLVDLLKKDNKKTQIYVTCSHESFMSSLDATAIAQALGTTGGFKVKVSASVLGKAMILNFIITEEGHTCSPKTTIPQVNATCLSNGTKTYYICSCGAKYLDSACTQQVTNDSQLEIKASSHTPSGWKNDASNHWTECTKCGSETINTRAAHSDGNKDNKCDTCSYALPVADANGNITIGGGTSGGNSSTSSNQTTSQNSDNQNNTSSVDSNTSSGNESTVTTESTEETTSSENETVITDETASTYEESYLYAGTQPNNAALKWILICGGAAAVVAAGIAVAIILIKKNK